MSYNKNKRTIFIHSVEIPKRIKNLMELDLWKAEDDCQLNIELEKEFNWSDKVSLFSNLDKRDTGLLTTSETEELKHIYGTYRTGDREDINNLDWIDANKAVMIAVNFDEEAICLDYRFSKFKPRIVATYFQTFPRGYGRWKEIAKNEDELISKLEIKM